MTFEMSKSLHSVAVDLDMAEITTATGLDELEGTEGLKQLRITLDWVLEQLRGDEERVG